VNGLYIAVNGLYIAVNGLYIAVDGFRWRLIRFIVVFLRLR